MWILMILLAPLLVAQVACLRRARERVQRMMRHGEDWDPEDLDHWLALIETFPLGEGRSANR